MEKDVLVSIKGLQFAAEDIGSSATDEDLDRLETICPGQYYFKNDAHYILYEELIEGFDEPIKNMMKLRGGEFILTKKGPINVQMVFSEGRKTMTDYCTPFGNIMVGIETQHVETVQTQESLDIHIEYALEANYQFVADCDIEIKIKNVEIGRAHV